MTTTTVATPEAGDKYQLAHRIGIGIFVVIPLLALLAAVPVAWGWGLGWTDIILFAVFYAIALFGVTMGYHRYFTHGGFETGRMMKILLAIAGGFSLQGAMIEWVAEHRRHHVYADKDGDPHTPYMYGTSPAAVAKGAFHAHLGWLFKRNRPDTARYARDLLKDRDLVRINDMEIPLIAASVLAPPLAGGLITWSWQGAVTAFFWASLVRICLLHHVTWSVNSICHILGTRPYGSQDKSTNFWPLAILSGGEAWHNGHHAYPESVRHGMRWWQIDLTHYMIWACEKLRLIRGVRWPDRQRLARLAAR